MVISYKPNGATISLSVSEFKQQIGALTKTIEAENAKVLVESYGKPKLMVVSAEHGAAMERALEKQLIRDAATRFRLERAQKRASGEQEPVDEAMEIAVQLVREFREEQAAKLSPEGE